MISKYYELKKKIKDNINFFLLYGPNTGLIDETINSVLKPIFSKNIYHYDENEVLAEIDEFKEKIFNKSFFEEDKLIIISRASDKILNIIGEIIDSEVKDLKIIIKSNILEKKSKLRTFFEKQSNTICIPFYEDNNQTLVSVLSVPTRLVSISEQEVVLSIRSRLIRERGYKS